MEYQFFGNSYYSPAFFRMKIDGPYDLQDFNEIPDAGVAFYLHEYIHFIQDISTIYGLMNIHNTIYYLQDIASRIGKQQERLFPVPYFLQDDKDDFGYSNHLLSRDYMGSPIQPFKKSIEIVSFNEVLVAHGRYNSHMVPFVEIKAIDNSDGVEFKFRLGGNHITEGMAYLAEQRVYGDILAAQGINFGTADYPYVIVLKLIEIIYPEMSEDYPSIIATCDASLMTYNPGVSFIRALEHLKRIGFVATGKSASSLYNILGGLLKGDHADLRTVSIMTRNLLLKNFKGDYFEGNNSWVNTVFDRALKIREEFPGFLIEILQPGDLKKTLTFCT